MDAINDLIYNVDDLTDDQELMGLRNISRNFNELNDYFNKFSFRLNEHIKKNIFIHDETKPFIVLDLCCGIGVAAEHLAMAPDKIINECKYGLFHKKSETVQLNKYIKVIGIDLKTNPRHVHNNLFICGLRCEKNLDDELAGYSEKNYAALINADATNIPLDDCSVDFIYSVAGLMYIPDKLRVFEEVYRILKPGGLAALHVENGKEGISLIPNAEKIFEETKGAEKIFSFNSIVGGYYNDAVLVKIQKEENDEFSGKFPYVFKEKIQYAGKNRQKDCHNLLNSKFVSAVYLPTN